MTTMIMKLAALLLLASLGSQLVASESFLGLFSGRAKEYKTLAKHLFESTESAELADNTKAAESLLSKRPDAGNDLVALTNTFKLLKVDKSDTESLCSKDNLANLRDVAEAMRDGGNLGPNKITEPIRRLNRMLVAYIAAARLICPSHLDTKWPQPWNPNLSEKDMQHYIGHLWIVPQSFLFKGYLGKPENRKFMQYLWGLGVSNVLAEDARRDLYAGKRLDPNEKHSTSTTNRAVLALQLHEYVYKPCKEFITLPEAHNVLVPYNNLLIGWYIINSELNNYFMDKKEPRVPQLGDDSYDETIKKFVLAHRACERLLPMPEEDVLDRTLKSRKLDQRPMLI